MNNEIDKNFNFYKKFIIANSQLLELCRKPFATSRAL